MSLHLVIFRAMWHMSFCIADGAFKGHVVDEKGFHSKRVYDKALQTAKWSSRSVVIKLVNRCGSLSRFTAECSSMYRLVL